MKLLLDANLSPSLVAPLTDAGYEVIHVADLGLLTASDDTILEHAAAGRRVVVTADSDFPMMLALRRATAPSVVLLRHVTNIPPSVQTALLVANLPNVSQQLAVRDLPMPWDSRYACGSHRSRLAGSDCARTTRTTRDLTARHRPSTATSGAGMSRSTRSRAPRRSRRRSSPTATCCRRGRQPRSARTSPLW